MVELLYRVVNLSTRGGVVNMVLQEVRTVPPEEIERARKEAEEPETDVVDEGQQFQKIESIPAPKNPLEEFFHAMRTHLPEMVEGFRNFPRMGDGGRVLMAVPLPSSYLIEMHISPEQYVEMGSPPLMAVLKVSMTALATGNE